MIICRQAKPTLTPFHLNHEDQFRFALSNGTIWTLELLGTHAEVRSHCAYGGLARDPGKKCGEIGSYAFSARVRVNGKETVLERIVGEQASFYEPWVIDGVALWLDAVACIFEGRGGFMAEKDWLHGYVCQPGRSARFAVQENHVSICPEPVHLWYPNTTGRLEISECYTGEDCWMGPYAGGAAHCGLDVNMPKGTVLLTPIRLDHHGLFHSVEAGFNNNRWRGRRRWPDGSEWQLQCHHLLEMLVPEQTSLDAGTAFATGAGTGVGLHPHSHFMFRVLDSGGEYWLDPWLLFWQAFKDQSALSTGFKRPA